MAKAYWIATYQAVHDESKLTAYANLAGPAIAAAGGKFLARGIPAHVYEDGLKERTVLIEFESIDKAVACHESDDYQAALKALDGGVARELRLIEGA